MELSLGSATRLGGHCCFIRSSHVQRECSVKHPVPVYSDIVSASWDTIGNESFLTGLMDHFVASSPKLLWKAVYLNIAASLQKFEHLVSGGFEHMAKDLPSRIVMNTYIIY